MKRLALLLALIAVISLSGAALADAAKFKGKIENGGRVAFELKRNKAGERKVVQWRWRNLRIDCGKDGKHNHGGNFGSYGMKVNVNRHFGAELVNPEFGNTATVDGSFPTGWRHAEGTLRVSGPTRWGQSCESGVVNWTATRR